MKLGIKWGNIDYAQVVYDFFELFIIPTFKDIGNGHMVTYLTPSMIVELFNERMPYIKRIQRRHKDYDMYNDPNYLANFFYITESDVFFDEELDKAIIIWDDFIYHTNGVELFVGAIS